MKVVSTDALTKLIQLIKSTFIKNTDVVQTTEVTLADVATTGAYSDLTGTPSAFTGADGTNTGTTGLVPAPTATDNTKYLKGDGTWATVDSLPSQTSQSGKFLTTNGTSASWGNLSSTNVTTALGYTPADDSNVVKTSGNQTIGGNKSFSGGVTTASGIGIKFDTADGTDYYQVRSAGSPAAGLSFLLNNNTSYNALKLTASDITIGNANITPLSVTPATSDNSTKIATTAFVKAQNYITGISSSDVTTALGYTPLQSSDISNMVTTNTDQTVTGKKILAGKDKTMLSNENVTKGTNPSSTQYINFGLFGDTTSSYTDRLGCMETSIDANGNVITYLRAYKNEASSSTEGHITVNYPASGSPYATAPTPTEDTNNSVQIDTVGARNTKLADYALDSDVVKTSGNQTIGGTKTFTSSPLVTKSSPVFYLKNTGITRATAPESNQTILTVNGVDSAGKNTWGIYHRYYTTTENRVDLICYKGTTTDNTWTSIGVGYNSSGNPYTYAPTPATSDNSTQIATTAYTRSYVSSRGDLVLYGTSSTAADTVAKVVDLSTDYNPSNISIRAGQLLVVTPTITSTVADSTLKVQITIDGTTTQILAAKTMKYNNANITTGTDSIVWSANIPSIFVYDGTYWQFLGHGLDNNTTYSAMSVSEGTTGTATSSRVMRADYLKDIIEGLALAKSNTYYDSSTSTLYIG